MLCGAEFELGEYAHGEAASSAILSLNWEFEKGCNERHRSRVQRDLDARVTVGTTLVRIFQVRVHAGAIAAEAIAAIQGKAIQFYSSSLHHYL